jgi:hypothetical protein
MTDHVNPQSPEPAEVASSAEAVLVRDTWPLWGPPERELEAEAGL